MKRLPLLFPLVSFLWSVPLMRIHSQPYTFTTIAGVAGTGGAVDGTNTGALFYNPSGVARDSAGNVYVADQLNHTIRRIAPVGTNWVVTTLAGLARASGSVDGTNTDARFNHPSGVAVDGTGNLFVTDTFNNTLRKIAPVGTNWVVTTVAGLAGNPGFDDGTNNAARFHSPQNVAVDQAATLYVSDRLNNTIRQVTPVGTNWVVTTIAGMASIYGGFVDGTNGDAQFSLPYGIAVKNPNLLYVADFANDAIRQITRIGPDWVTTTITGFSGKPGTNDGPASQATFNSPNGIVVDGSGNLYVADQYNNTLRKVVPIGTNWTVSTVAGVAKQAGSNDGTGSSALFYRPWGIAIDPARNLYVADAFNDTIRRGMPPVPPNPSLQILASQGQIVISWPAAASNYLLETTETMNSGALWISLTNGPIVSGDKYVFSTNVSGAAAFYRLREVIPQ